MGRAAIERSGRALVDRRARRVPLLRPSKSVAGRLVASLAGGLLVARALSGRDGAIAALKRSSQRASEAPDYIEVAAPWPYARRVRITTPERTRRPEPSLEPAAAP